MSQEHSEPLVETKHRGPLLNGDALRKGDVILTRCSKNQGIAGALVTTAIRMSTVPSPRLAEFTHAAIIVETGMIFEADGLGVGFSHLDYLGSAKHNGNLIPLFQVAYDIDDAVVLRHPEADKISLADIEKTLKSTIHELFGLDYSHLQRLVDASKLTLLKPVFRLLCRLADAWISRDKTDGPFCSEVVGIFYSNLGRPLGDPKAILPGDICPEELRSLLVSAPDAIVQVRDFGLLTEFQGTDDGFTPLLPRKETLPLFVKQNRDIKKICEAWDGIKTRTGEIQKQQASAMRDNLIAHCDELLKLIDAAIIQRDSRNVSRWLAMAQELESLAPGVLELNTNAVLKFGALTKHMLRVSCLQSLRVAREIHRSETNPIKRRRLQAFRRRAIREYNEVGKPALSAEERSRPRPSRSDPPKRAASDR